VDSTVTGVVAVPFNFSLVSIDAPPVTKDLSIFFGTSGTILDLESSNGYLTSESGWVYGSPTQTIPHSGAKVWATNLTGTYANNANISLTTPTIALGDNPTLTFWHYLSCQNYYDGGNVSLSNDDGATWIVLTPVGGYNTSFSIYSLGEYGYTNNISWTQSTFNLGAYANSNVKIRWRFASNGTVASNGWVIDDIMISSYYITPGLVTGTVTLATTDNLTSVKIATDDHMVANPDSSGTYKMYLPQGLYSLTASLPYYSSQVSPSFSLNNAESSYNYDFTLEFLANPTELNLTIASGDSIVYLTWVEPAHGTYPVLGYKVYRQFGVHPYTLVGQTTATAYNEQLYEEGTYHYYVQAVYEIGAGAQSDIVAVLYPYVGNNENVTEVFVNSLQANYPNPFSKLTNIAFSTAKAGPVSMKIYNTKGQLVKTIANEAKAAGKYNLVWNGLDNSGNRVASGLYFYRMESKDYSKTRKMMLMK
jgi:hypothetical protein